ncbi:TonB family protein [Mucilaginibacter gotjawali]|uniref:Gram-negative bacterial tonB protein n=2 Tax=Mucilaginibacter gotjawali TaxID=1550579 RepID=A0A0X8X2X1_9SPHI|nr:TonB family protein [Mucilaginibacter gotjawali]MBB3055795.1 TonB family protein [Mucilaginibacter gotjawali]BAU54616.1 Gram-negative bacterial tonB protein [Mucilaginibacter gotjawali]
MKKLVFLIAIVHLSSKINAQTFTTREDIGPAFNKVDTDPVYPGGFGAFDNYIDLNAAKILKPDHALGMVAVKFLVEKNGKVTNAEVIKGLTPETDSAAVYLIKNSLLWKPGIKNGVAVPTLVKIGVKFRAPRYAQIVHVQDVQLSKGNNADITIDEPIESPIVTEEVDPNHIFTSVEKIPEFPGGIAKFLQFIKDHQKLKIGLNGKGGRVIVLFVVEKDGSLSDIKIARGFSPEYDAEALRLLKLMPKWIPGIQNGRRVRVQYPVAINLGLN